MNPNDVTLGILAGGTGSRLGGVDKGLITLHDQPLVSHIQKRLSPLARRTIISSNREDDVYQQWSDHIVADSEPYADLGPLAGILAMLQGCDTPWLLVLPCDAPAFPFEAAQCLLSSAEQNGKAAVIRIRQRVNPVCCALNIVNLAPIESALQTALKTGNCRTGEVILSLQPDFVDYDDDRPGLWSLNTAEELAACQSRFIT